MALSRSGAIVTKDEHGNLFVPDARDIGSAWGLLGGGIIGGLLGLLFGPAGAVVGTAAGASLGAVNHALADLPEVAPSDEFLGEGVVGFSGVTSSEKGVLS